MKTWKFARHRSQTRSSHTRLTSRRSPRSQQPSLPVLNLNKAVTSHRRRKQQHQSLTPNPRVPSELSPHLLPPAPTTLFPEQALSYSRQLLFQSIQQYVPVCRGRQGAAASADIRTQPSIRRGLSPSDIRNPKDFAKLRNKKGGASLIWALFSVGSECRSAGAGGLGGANGTRSVSW